MKVSKLNTLYFGSIVKLLNESLKQIQGTLTSEKVTFSSKLCQNAFPHSLLPLYKQQFLRKFLSSIQDYIYYLLGKATDTISRLYASYASLPGFPNSNIYSDLYISLNIIFSIFTILVFAVTFATFILEYLLFNDLGCLQAHKSILKANGIVSSITFYTLEMFYHKFANQSNYQTIDLISFTLGICIYLVQTILFLNQRLFRLSAFIISIFGVVFTPLPRFIVLLVFSLFYLQIKIEQEQDILITVIIASIWSLLQTQTSSNSGVIAFLSLGLILSSIVGSYYFQPFKNDNYLQLETNKRLLQFYKKRVQKEHEHGQQSLKINMEEELIYEKYHKEVLHSYSMVKYFGKRQPKTTKEPYQAMVLFYFQARVILSNRVIPLLKEMSVYFLNNQNGEIMSNYEHYKLIKEVFKYYEQSGIGIEISLQVSDIIESQNNYHCFYVIINSLLLELADYINCLLL